MSGLTFEVWNVGAREPIGRTADRNLARSAMLVEVGFMCQGGAWVYRSSIITGSSILADCIELVHREDPTRVQRFEVRPVTREGADADAIAAAEYDRRGDMLA